MCNGDAVDYHERLLCMIMDGTVRDRRTLQAAKIALSKEYGLGRVPPNSETLARADPDTLPVVERLLRRKPVRTLSGVAVVAVMTSPAPCPHGKCSYCPGGVEAGSPQSYTGKEPAARRALANEFDPFGQVSSRIRQLGAIGHPTDKIDLIIMGGTFTSRPVEYQKFFVQRCFEALNGGESVSLAEAHQKNESSAHRCIGMTIETRPDVFDGPNAAFSMELGATRVELGVQILDDDVLSGVNRGHGVEEVVQATKTAKDMGLKVCYHIMPGLPGSDPEKDIESFARVFSDERFRPDMIKIYPTLVIKGTSLHDMWLKGAYSPYSTE
ncbi:MAG: tRNA uridine(34) 5-carboxymethylaminomethyl modification radical SAM/GNAT enzyme Elp3, partial [Methanomassiliicoccales archaeon]|nr:tRNA uridine(34) 5-carboxymethylaminomethyl modification radical SAM/GNAT enzyme Elp3 [Methanomassiliicoccales archaeon]